MAMNVGAAREGEPVSEINTTPLIDVMLVLLIMLIVTAAPAPRREARYACAMSSVQGAD